MATLTQQRQEQKQQNQLQRERELQKHRQMSAESTVGKSSAAIKSSVEKKEQHKSSERRLTYEELLQQAERNKLELLEKERQQAAEVPPPLVNNDVSKRKAVPVKQINPAISRPAKSAAAKPNLLPAPRHVVTNKNANAPLRMSDMKPVVSRNAPQQAISKMFKNKKKSAVSSYAKNQAVSLNTVKRDLRTIEEIQEDIQRRKKSRNEHMLADEPSVLNGNKLLLKPGTLAITEKPAVSKVVPRIESSVNNYPMKRQKSDGPSSKEKLKSIHSPSSASKKIVVGKNEAFDVYDDTYVKGNFSSIISDMFGKKKRVDYDDDDFDDADMEASARQIEFEERRSAKIGKLEDLKEEELQRQQELKLKKKRKEKAK